MKIYHNPRCRKSREGLAILKASGIDFEVVEYLKNPISVKELKEIINLLDIKPIDLVRKNEKIWKENYKGEEWTQTQIIEAMIQHPTLIERPIAVHQNKAVLGRPPELIKSIL